MIMTASLFFFKFSTIYRIVVVVGLDIRCRVCFEKPIFHSVVGRNALKQMVVTRVLPSEIL